LVFTILLGLIHEHNLLSNFHLQHVEPYYNAPSYDAGQVKSFNPKKPFLA
jgi:hypothetical protein